MPRVAEKDHMKDYEIGYYQRFDPMIGPPLIAGPVGAGFNAVSRLNVKTHELKTLAMDRRTTVQEHIHIPSKQKGHEGYLAFVADIHDEPYSQVWIVEAEHLERGPIAKLRMPLRLRTGVHGNWVPAAAF
jgi:carotenoid cleavage dioxygenase